MICLGDKVETMLPTSAGVVSDYELIVIDEGLGDGYVEVNRGLHKKGAVYAMASTNHVEPHVYIESKRF